MNLVQIPMDRLREAPWNPNVMDANLRARLIRSLQRFGLVSPLVVRPLDLRIYEVLSGNQRLGVLRDLGFLEVPSIVVDLDDAPARLLAQALNRIHGEDDLGIRAEVVKRILADMPQHEALEILPDSSANLAGLASLGAENVAQYLKRQLPNPEIRLHGLTLQLTENQLDTIVSVLGEIAREVSEKGPSPNRRGTALFALCEWYIKTGGGAYR